MKQTVLAIALCVGMNAVYADTTLQQAIESTIQTNPDVLAAVNERKASDKRIDEAKAGYLPTLDLTVGKGWEAADNPITRAEGKGEVHLNREEANLTFRQMLFDGMQTKNEVRRATASTDSAAYSVYTTAEDTALKAVKAYLDVLRRQKLVDLANTNLEAHQRNNDQIKLRSDRGVGRRSDMDQSTGRLALAQANLIAEESNLRDAQTTYQRIVGEAPKDLQEPQSPLKLIPASLDEAINEADNNHPTLKTAEEDVQAAMAQHDTAEAPFYPRVHLEIGATSDHNIDGQVGMNKDLAAMIRLRYNLLNGGKDSARREETAYLLNKAQEIRNNTRRQVEESVRLSWSALQTVNQQLQYFKQHVDSSEKSRDAYQLQFNLGQRTLLDLLDSENEVFKARTDYVNAKYDQLYAMYRVLNSMGMLLEGLKVTAPKSAQIVDASDKK